MKKIILSFLLFTANITFAQLGDVIDAKSAGIKNYPIVAGKDYNLEVFRIKK